MKKRRTLRRCLLTIAVTAAPGFSLVALDAVVLAQSKPALHSAKSALRPGGKTLKKVPNTRVQTVAFEPQTQSPPPKSTSVTQELDRLYRENGGQMPSMRAMDLPNANTPTKNLIQQKPEKKPSLLSKIFGRFRGRTSPEKSTATPVPPPLVLPGSQTPVPNAQNRATNSPPKPSAAVVKTPQPVAGKPVPQPRPTGTPASVISRTTQNSVSRSNAQTDRPTGVSNATQTVELPGPQDDFINPFEESERVTEESQLLDLDALIHEQKQAIGEVDRPSSVDPEPQIPQQSAAANPFAESTPQEESAPVAIENPFTGYQLEISSRAPVTEPQIDNNPDLARTSDDLPESVPSDVSAGNSEAIDLSPPSFPMATFDENAPVIELPPADFEETELTESTAAPAPQAATVKDVAPESWKVAEPERSAAGNASDPATVTQQKPLPPPAEPTAQQRIVRKQVDRQAQQRQRILARSGLSGFKGFCPVALRDRRELVDSSRDLSATFGLNTYYFSSIEARTAFETDPTRYAPAAGGSDVVVLVNSGEEEPGRLDFALWYRDRLYLFRARETMTLFAQNPQRFSDQY